MATFETKHAGREFAFITSNQGIRVEIDGVEVFRSWGADVTQVTPRTFQQAYTDADDGGIFNLGPGEYPFASSGSGPIVQIMSDRPMRGTITVE